MKPAGIFSSFDRLFEKADPVFSHFLIQCGVVDSEKFSGVLLVAVKSFQHLYQDGPLQETHKVFQVGIFLHIKVLDKKIEKSFEIFLLLDLYLIRQTPGIICEELKDLLRGETGLETTPVQRMFFSLILCRCVQFLLNFVFFLTSSAIWGRPS